jgi:hypothetical protein
MTLSVLLTVSGRLDAQNDADKIIEKAVAAHGGDKVAKMQVMVTKAHGKLNVPNFGDAEFEVETLWQLPSQYKSAWHTQIKNQTINSVVVVNRRQGWRKANDMQSEEIPEPNFKELREQMHAERLDKILPLTGKSLTLRTLGVTQDPKLPGQTLTGILVKAEDHREVRMYFDKDTGLLAKRENDVKDVKSGQQFKQEIYFTAYKETEGVKVWTRFVIFRDGQRFLEAEITEVKFFETLPDAMFSQP